MNTFIPFNKPFVNGSELKNILEASQLGQLSGDGIFTEKCSTFLTNFLGSYSSFLTHSCTAALEMCAILLNIQQGDEIIMPSYTFVSTANAFVLRGAVPVFVDIDIKTGMLNHHLIEDSISENTKAIIVVHYAGATCDMDPILNLARKHNLYVVEDAAQAINSKFKNKFAGSFGDLSTFSFHETKNVISGEGGSLNINVSKFDDRAAVIREKGTNRRQFFQGNVDKYTWVDIGSSYLPGELIASFLYAQLLNIEFITNKRLQIWYNYHHRLEPLERQGYIIRQIIPPNVKINGHIYYIRLQSEVMRNKFLTYMKSHNIQCTFHYIPLHSSPMGKNCSIIHSEMTSTNIFSSTLVRLPIWIGVDNYQDYIIEKIFNFFLNYQ